MKVLRNATTITGAVLATGSLLLTAIPTQSAAPADSSPQRSQQGQSQQSGSKSAVISPTWKTFSTALGRGTKIVVSTGGNITSYVSPNQVGAAYEHIGVGAVGEGYVVCYNGIGSYDLGDTSSGFAAPTTTTSAVSRKTTDGKVLLTQTFTLTPGQPTTPTNFLVNMTIKNLSQTTLTGVTVRRQVDFDIDTGGAQGWAGFQSNHGRTHATVSAFHDPTEAPAGRESHGISLGLVKAAGTWETRVTSSILDPNCNPTAAPLDANFVSRGDYGDTLMFGLGSVAPGAQKTVSLRYERF